MLNTPTKTRPALDVECDHATPDGDIARPVLAARPAPATERETGMRRRTRSRLGWGAIGAGLTAAAVYNARQAKRAERDKPAEGQFVEIDGVRVHYVEQGEGPPVLLFHGNAVSLSDWQRSGVMAAIVQAGHRVIAFDRPGSGHTPRPRDRVWTLQCQGKLLLDAASAIGADKPVIVGHSIGASIALAAAAARPAEVGGLVLISGYYYWTARADVPMVAPPTIPVIGDIIRYTISPLFGRAMWKPTVKAMFSPMDVPAGFVEDSVGLTTRPSQIRATSADGVLMGPSMNALVDRYSGLQTPTVIIAGDSDRIVGHDRQSRKLCETLPHCTYRVLTGVGHMVPYADPHAVAQAVEDVTSL